MHPEEFTEMAAIEASHFWFEGKRLILAALLDRAGLTGGRVLDLGCGTGGILGALAAWDTVFGLDADAGALAFCKTRGLARLIRGSALEIPVRDGAFDACVMFDLLEHVDDEVGLLREVRRILRPGGVVLISVPAFMALWSPHDEVFQHRRRYRRPELVARLREAGFGVDWSTYTNTAIFPPALAWRTLRRRTAVGGARRTDFFRLPAVLNQAIVGLYRGEAAWLRRGTLPFGVSTAAIAHRT